MSGGTGVGAVWAQECFQQMCRFFCMPPKGSAPELPDGLTSLSEWITNPHSLWRHVRARRKTLSSLCFKAEETSLGKSCIQPNCGMKKKMEKQNIRLFMKSNRDIYYHYILK